MEISALRSSLSSSQAALQVLQQSVDSQVDLAQKMLKVSAAQETVAAKMDNLGTVVDMYV